MAQGDEVTCIADVQAVLGEGPVWVAREQALYWVDIVERRLFRWTEGVGAGIVDIGQGISALAPRASGGFIGAGEGGFLGIDLESGRIDRLGNPESDRVSNRFNDGKTDRRGRFWAGTMDRSEREPSGALYRLDRDLSWAGIDDGYRVTNGPAFSLDGRTMYHSDSALRRIYAFDLGEDGSAANRRVFAEFGSSEGYPDGMTVDAEDCLWVAFWDGWCLRRLSPCGARLSELRVPVQQPTSCTFGGPALDRLFITSARRGLREDALAMQPHAGALFVAEAGVAGVAETPFAG